MNKLLQIADQAASQETLPSSTSMDVSPEIFSGFMRQNPIWDFYGTTKSDYMAMPEGEKLKLVDRYYRHMSDGKSKFLFRSCLIQLRMLALGPK